VAVAARSILMEAGMIDPARIARIRQLYFGEHWKVGTIASELGLHPSTVKGCLSDRPRPDQTPRPSPVTPYLGFIEEVLREHPRLRATRIYEMVRLRGYTGSLRQLRRKVAVLRPRTTPAYLRLRSFPAEQAQVDWGHFGKVRVRGGERRLSCFVMTLSYSRALYLEFFFDQSQESFLRGHVGAFEFFDGVARTLLYDNLKSAVQERISSTLVHFHPRLLELAAHYHFQPKPCAVGQANQKGRVERAIRYIRESFFAARSFTTLDDFNRQARLWRDEIAHTRPWPDDTRRTVAEVFAEEKPYLVPLPQHPFDTDQVLSVVARKTLYVRYDANEYSIPPSAVGHPLTLVASDTLIRILEGTRELARHGRSYDRKQRIEDEEHLLALLQNKRKAQGSVLSARLLGAVAKAEDFLQAAFQRGESPGSQMKQLLELLDRYGASPLQTALQEALERDTPRASSVAYLLERRRRALKARAAIPVDLSRRPDLADLHVNPHSPEIYDELTSAQEDES
jgi:transposase